MARETYKVVGKLKAWHVGIGVFEVDNNELLVLICGKQKGRFSGRNHTQ